MNYRVKRRVILGNQEGLHLRAADKVCQEARKFPCDLTVTYAGRTANAKSIFELIGLVAGRGSELTLEATGAQACEAVERLEQIILGLTVPMAVAKDTKSGRQHV